MFLTVLLDSANISFRTRQWWCMPLILELRRKRQADFWEFKASLVYWGSSKTSRGTLFQEKKNWFFFLCKWVFCLSVWPVCLWPKEARRGLWVPWGYSYRVYFLCGYQNGTEWLSKSNMCYTLILSHVSIPSFWLLMCIISALLKLRKVGCGEFETTLDYIVSSRLVQSSGSQPS